MYTQKSSEFQNYVKQNEKFSDDIIMLEHFLRAVLIRNLRMQSFTKNLKQEYETTSHQLNSYQEKCNTLFPWNNLSLYVKYRFKIQTKIVSRLNNS